MKLASGPNDDYGALRTGKLTVINIGITTLNGSSHTIHRVSIDGRRKKLDSPMTVNIGIYTTATIEWEEKNEKD